MTGQGGSDATAHGDQVEVEGEVLEVDLRRRSFQLWIDGRTPVTVVFTDAQEADVTTALKEHANLRLRVVGRGEISRDGELRRIDEVGTLEIRAVDDNCPGRSGRPIEEILREIASEVPQEEWDKLPDDLSENLDDYIYGSPEE